MRDVEYSFAALLNKKFAQVSQILFVRSVAGAKGSIADIRLVVLLDEIANVDLLLPETTPNPSAGSGLIFGLLF